MLLIIWILFDGNVHDLRIESQVHKRFCCSEEHSMIVRTMNVIVRSIIIPFHARTPFHVTDSFTSVVCWLVGRSIGSVLVREVLNE
jgi:hypothetical protein